MEEKKVKCNNCREEISESKLVLHEAFCLRNNKYCEKCQKVILTSEYDEHIKSHDKKKEEPKPIKKEIIQEEKFEDDYLQRENYDNFKKINVLKKFLKKRRRRKKMEEERIKKRRNC